MHHLADLLVHRHARQQIRGTARGRLPPILIDIQRAVPIEIAKGKAVCVQDRDCPAAKVRLARTRGRGLTDQGRNGDGSEDGGLMQRCSPLVCLARPAPPSPRRIGRDLQDQYHHL
ncbi:hypothetical protein [Sphingomonas sp.]|uniref:hypothetical protein n=1 Tax=Sphingomonas sp. TaxID=28214 RepID=UPI003B3AE147